MITAFWVKKLYFNIAKIEETGLESESKAEKAKFLLKIAKKNIQKRISIEKLVE